MRVIDVHHSLARALREAFVKTPALTADERALEAMVPAVPEPAAPRTAPDAALVQQLQDNPHPQAFKAAGVWPQGKSYQWRPGKQGARERARRQRQAAKARG